jgi:hypothetical protein
VAVGTVLLAAILGLGSVYALARIFKPQAFGPFMIGVPDSELILVTLIVGIIAIVLLLRDKPLKRFNSSENLAGSIVIWLSLAIATNFVLPGASYLFQWPAFFATLGLISSQRFRIALTATPSALLLAPTILLVHQTITIGIAPVSLALVAMATSLSPTHSDTATS